MIPDTRKLLAGMLLAGMGILTGEASLIATAGAVGANWRVGGGVGRAARPHTRSATAACLCNGYSSGHGGIGS